ncbi:large-conductance mechanosensitive channel protein MscL [Clostridium hydrogeniformans]|uniref:large-conductance mechanosensitive channel protein MscL n=1 Tax=Clostridium hydrogeniformans TaxID=349933 RepID=UPI000488D1FD|nr:large-conductance mechanosensitive channel protein MscL [Clostridium hydrogeniformans]
MLKEFKEFAMKGNVMDLAIGVVVGGAFGKIVTSLVNDVIMPLVGLLLGGLNFTYLSIPLRAEKDGIPALTLNYGSFIQNIVDFIIIAFSIFLFIKLLGNFKKKEEVQEVVEEVKISDETKLLMEIRDLLKEEK